MYVNIQKLNKLPVEIYKHLKKHPSIKNVLKLHAHLIVGVYSSQWNSHKILKIYTNNFF